MSAKLSTTPILLQTTQNETLLSMIPFTTPMNHPDVIWVNPEGQGLVIDDTRALVQNVITKPYQESYRVFVIQHLELATIEAQQALLKLFEEPPAHIRFILTSEYPSMILPTILSRVQISSKWSVAPPKADQPKAGSFKPQATSHKLQATEFEDQSTHYENIQLFDLAFASLSDRLNWAAKPELQDQAMRAVLSLYEQQINEFEKQPSLQNITKLNTLKKCLEFLRAKTNTKLCLEWLVLHW